MGDSFVQSVIIFLYYVHKLANLDVWREEAVGFVVGDLVVGFSQLYNFAIFKMSKGLNPRRCPISTPGYFVEIVRSLKFLLNALGP